MASSSSFNHWGNLAAALTPACSEVVQKTATALQAEAKRRAPVRTGFLRDSIHVVNSGSATEAEVVVGADYGVFVNYGTRFMPAQPFWESAIEAVRSEFEAAGSIIEAKLAQAAG